MQSGYNINDLVQEAQIRWLKPPEVLFILQNYEQHQLTHEPPQKPASGSLFFFNKRVLRFFRKDGYNWRRKKDGRTVGEAHERLKVGNVEALNCYYAHGEEDPNFQRRSYWMLDPAYGHIVLVHYRDTSEGRCTSGSISLLSPGSSSTFSQSPSSYTAHHPGSTAVISESYESYQSPGSTEASSGVVINNNGRNHFDRIERAGEISSSPEIEITRALRRLEEQLSLDDDKFRDIDTFCIKNEDSNDSECIAYDPSYSRSAGMQDDLNSLLLQRSAGDSGEHHQQPLGRGFTDRSTETLTWKGMLQSYESSPGVESQEQHVYTADGNRMLLPSSKEVVEEQETYHCLFFSGNNPQKASTLLSQEVEDFKFPAYSPTISTHGINPDYYETFLDQGQIGMHVEADTSLTIAQKQKFTIREISPEWVYASETTKVIIIGSFLCDPSDYAWTCMLGDIEVPLRIIQEGVICCQAPPHLPGKVSLCITSGNRESCSEVREFEYRVKPSSCAHCNFSEAVASRSPEELLLLVRFAQMLLSDPPLQKGDSTESGIDLLGKYKAGEDFWGQVIEAILVGTWTSSGTIDWLLQELLKDKLQEWLVSRSRERSDWLGCFLSKKEQGIIHMVAGLGFEWALNPILNSGVGVNFRDINGCTALHWAARFGREKMVAALIAYGASAGAVTDPSSQDPSGKTPASIAATSGHKGLAGYLSEVALTSHLSSLILEENELSKGSADVEAERAVNSVSNMSFRTTEDQITLKDTLAAVRNAAQAAARIQSAFRAHSFRRRQARKAGAAAASSGDDYSILPEDIQALSAASKLAFRTTRDYNAAALSIQKKYRGWKGRKDFLAFRQKVVKIQAHIRGHQVRKNYKVCWAVGILEKVVLRWRRRGVGLRGFRQESESIDESEDEDILKVFRKQKVDAAIDEAVSRVLSMVDSQDARQQYRRMLESYRQAKAELEGAQSAAASTSQADIFKMDNDDIYQFP